MSGIFEPGLRAIFEVNDDETCTMTVSLPDRPDIIGVVPTAVVELIATVLPSLTGPSGLDRQFENALVSFLADPDAAGPL